MNRFRFSTRSIFVVTTLVAFGLASIVSQLRLAASAVYTINFGLLCISVAGAFLGRANVRAFWLGFAVFAWSYWLIAFENTTPRRASGMTIFYSSWQNEMLPQPRLLTSELIEFFETHITTSRAVGAKVSAQWRNGGFYPGTITDIGSGQQSGQYLVQWDDGSAVQWTPNAQVLPDNGQIRVTSHAMFNSLVGLIGGVLSAVLFGGTPRDEGKTSQPAKLAAAE